MKKAIWVVGALLPVVVILGLIGLRADSVHVGAQEAEACFRYGKTDVLQRLDGADLVELAAIVDGKRLYRDSPSCGFDENVSVRFGAQTFCIARDPCPILYYKEKNRYIRLSEKEKTRLYELPEPPA